MILILVHFDYNDHKKAQFIRDVLEQFSLNPVESRLVSPRVKMFYLKFTTEKSGKIKVSTKPPVRRSLIGTLSKNQLLTTPTTKRLSPKNAALLAPPSSVRPRTATLIKSPTITSVRPKTAPLAVNYQLPLDWDPDVPCTSEQTRYRDIESRAREEAQALEDEETLRENESKVRILAESMVASEVFILDKKLRQKEKVRKLYVQFSSKLCSKLVSMKSKGSPTNEIREQLLKMVEPILEQLYIVVLGDENGDFDKEAASWEELEEIREPIVSLIENLLVDLKNRSLSTVECMKAAKNQLWLSESKTGLDQSARALQKVIYKIK